jgi:hypothetical protein
MGVWDVLAESDREQWTYTPSVGVGPLRFGMSPEEAVKALAGFTGTVHYAPGGDPGADEPGLIVAVQRAGDVVLTRPAMLIEREYAFTLWDALLHGEGAIR